ncbi:hypothetical protein GQX73_g5439 [Xylaria multiplex]|uniref:Uncharacterized protein n=1 Tax=Xylaria multiplex TaxID=323545 RepID=A0A7C8MU50_9PEZI|nr:hypothetical protein GQX73_g5439 [Xylaria multiplex]
MHKGATDSSKSVLLDYISPIPPISLYRSILNRHWAVACSLLDFVILKGVMVASSLFLIATPVELSDQRQISFRAAFNEFNLWKFVESRDPSNWGTIENNYDHGTAYNVPSNPIYSYIARLNGANQDLNRTQNGLTFQTLKVDEQLENVTSLSAVVTTFVPNVTCERADIEFHNNSTTPVSIHSSSCFLESDFDIPWFDSQCQASGVCLQYDIRRANCTRVNNDKPASPFLTYLNQTTQDLRFSLRMVSYKNTSSGLTLLKSPATICKVDYNLQQAKLVQDLSQNRVSLTLPDALVSNSRFQNLTGIELGEMLFAALNGITGDIDPNFAGVGVISILPLMVFAKWIGRSLQTLLEQENMSRAAKAVFEGLASQLAQQFIPVPSQQTEEGSCVHVATRLRVQPPSLWVMFAGFVVLPNYSIPDTTLRTSIPSSTKKPWVNCL